MNQKNLDANYIKQLEKIIKNYTELDQQARYDDLSDIKREKITSLLVQSRAAVERISGLESPYSKQVHEFLAKYSGSVFQATKHVIGVVYALADDLENGYLKSVSELLHAEVFSDYLSMADHLLEEGYKDAAAVLAGGTIEAHLKQLCAKHSVDTEYTDKNGVIRSKKADKLNADLVKANAYSKQDQKNITAWLGLRNDAAHANYSSYEDQQVRLVIFSIRDFITRVPA